MTDWQTFSTILPFSPRSCVEGGNMIDLDLIVRLYNVGAEIGKDISDRLARSFYHAGESEDKDRAFILLGGIGTAVTFVLGILFFGLDTRAFVPPIWFFIYVWSYHPYVPGPRTFTLFGAWSEDHLIVVIVYRVITVLGLLAGLVCGIPQGVGLTMFTLIVTYILFCMIAKYVDEKERELAEQLQIRR